jgi:hypothetical protein
MAIQDRNLSVGTKLNARYKGQTYAAEVAEKEGKLVYRLADGREFKSPSAAGTAISGLACNGWAFWSVGDSSENTGPVSSTRARKPARSTVHPAPKPQVKRGRRSQTPESPPSDEAADASTTVDEPGESSTGELSTHDPADDAPLEVVRCAACGEEFQGVQAATEHYYAIHGKPEDDPTA